MEDFDPTTPDFAQVRADTQTDLAEEINRPQGWSRAGITFQYVPDGGADIEFYISNQYTDTPCRDASTVVGCASHGAIGSCEVWLKYPVHFHNGGIGWSNQPVAIVNHELGHCFGFEHRETGLMKEIYDASTASEEDYFPTDDMIAAVRKKVA